MDPRQSIITFTTDFGITDPFVGEMKGVILSINPLATIVDITHSITTFDILGASLLLGDSYRFFPRGTIHIAVVDPGVGSERKPLVIRADGHFFVGPDNGLFTTVIEEAVPASIIEITEKRYTLALDSPTFQGRDIFAPAAAWLSKGIAPSSLGRPVRDIVRIRIPKPILHGRTIKGEVIAIDRFGNAITNITKPMVDSLGRDVTIFFQDTILTPVHHYAEARPDTLGCLFNSSNRLELFFRTGSAATQLHIKRGESVLVGS